MHNTIIKQKNCIFCEEQFPKIIFSNQHFVIALDNFPLTEGHLLIFSKGHYGCGGELPKENLNELATLKEGISQVLRDIYGNVSFYEHGRAGHCVSFGYEERLCHHFHLHALPIAHDVTKQLDAQFQHMILPSYDLIDTFFNQYGEYLLYETNDKKAKFYPIDTQIPSHLLRTLVANALGFPERADWENFNDTTFITQALDKASAKITFKS